jgi:hypothetical protein
MAPIRRRMTALLVAAGLLLVAVVGLAWFLTGDDPPGGAAQLAPTVPSATPAARPATTTAAAPAAGPTSPAGGTAGGGGDTSGPPVPPAPACPQVISDAEASAALGAAVARTEARDGFLVRTCTFWTSSDRYLLVQVNRGVAASREQFELSRLPADQTVSGIGQAARWTRDTGLLDVLDGPARFQVGLFTPAGTPAATAPQPRLEAAARAIAARL